MRALVLAAPALALVTGCIVVDREYTDPFDAMEDGALGPDNGEYSDLQVRSGRVSGDLGPVRDFDAEATDSYGYSESGYSSVTVTAYDDRGRMGMLIVDLSGADIRSVRTGTYRFGALSTDSVEGGTPSVIGCSEGSDAYYDAPADEGTMVISDTPAGRQVDVEAQLPTDDGMGSTQATGTFVISRQ